MFDFEQEDTRDELELMEAGEKEEEEGAKEEVAVDLRPPDELIEEYIQTLILLIERQPAAAAKARAHIEAPRGQCSTSPCTSRRCARSPHSFVPGGAADGALPIARQRGAR